MIALKAATGSAALLMRTKGNVALISKRCASHGHRAPVPVYIRRPVESKNLPEEHELLWDDAVAPELCVDFDATHLNPYVALGMFFGGIGSLVGLGIFVKFVVSKEVVPIAEKRKFPYDGLLEEFGGEPGKFTNTKGFEMK